MGEKICLQTAMKIGLRRGGPVGGKLMIVVKVVEQLAA
jgi:hypothetical protein